MNWADVRQSIPELAADAEESFRLGNHKTLATVDAEGAPRISAVEAYFIDDDLWVASIWGTPKAQDLNRDPRMALHSWSADPEIWMGDAKVRGTADEVTDAAAYARFAEAAGTSPPGRFHLFRILLTEVVVLRLNAPERMIEVRRWSPGSSIVETRLG